MPGKDNSFHCYAFNVSFWECIKETMVVPSMCCDRGNHHSVNKTLDFVSINYCRVAIAFRMLIGARKGQLCCYYCCAFNVSFWEVCVIIKANSVLNKRSLSLQCDHSDITTGYSRAT